MHLHTPFIQYLINIFEVFKRGTKPHMYLKLFIHHTNHLQYKDYESDGYKTHNSKLKLISTKNSSLLHKLIKQTHDLYNVCDRADDQ